MDGNEKGITKNISSDFFKAIQNYFQNQHPNIIYC